jgi:hypothetical protein
MVGDEYTLTEHGEDTIGEPTKGATTVGSTPSDPTYPTPLSLESWQLREWLGLALFVLTMLTAVGLTLFSNQILVLQQRKRQSPPSSYFLTEQGVGELLQLGWRYHHHADNDQLVLQVFDNQGRDHYDENNSPLQQQQVLVVGPPHHRPSSTTTATACTPPSLEPRRHDDADG